ncbi:hypothetical protein F4604DRAFT_1680707 [Suillus subluteus]|nr:hypothetical protein F4604DRAFT_1680707 [Suillus subluteus]
MPRWQPTRDQHAWLMPRLSKFQRLPFSKDKVFRVQLHKDWLEDWPERDALWPDLAGQALALTEHQQHELDSAEAALEQTLKEWISWAWLNPRRARKMYGRSGCCGTDDGHCQIYPPFPGPKGVDILGLAVFQTCS